MITTSRDELTVAALSECLRVAALVESLHPADATRAAPGLDWTVRDVATHVVNLLGRALGDMRRSSTPAETAVLNQACIDEVDTQSLTDLAATIRDQAPIVFEQVLPLFDDTAEFPFHAGIETTIPQVTGVLLMEFLVHGDDIAQATNRPWPIDDHTAYLGVAAATPLLRGWLRDGRGGRSTFSFASPSQPSLTFVVSEDRVELADADPDADRPADDAITVVDVAPSELVLALFGRRPVTDARLRAFTSLFEPF